MNCDQCAPIKDCPHSWCQYRNGPPGHATKAEAFCADLPTIPDTVTAGELVEAAQSYMDAEMDFIGASYSNDAEIIEAAASVATTARDRLQAILDAFKDKSNG